MAKAIDIEKHGRIHIIVPQLVSGKHGEVKTRVCKLPVNSIIIMKLSIGYLMIDHSESYDIAMLTESKYEINSYLKETYGIEVVNNE